jgi:hypothetical protein
MAPLRAFEGEFTMVLLPDTTSAFYGRDVGDKIERIDLTPICMRFQRRRYGPSCLRCGT